MSREAEANRDAWAAVKRDYTRDDETGQWHPAGEVPEHEEEEEDGGIIETIKDAIWRAGFCGPIGLSGRPS